MTAASKSLVPSRSERSTWIGGSALAPLALASGVGAVFASSCCAIPLVFASLGAGSATFTLLTSLVSYRIPLLVIGATILAFACLMYFRKRPETCDLNDCEPTRRSLTTGVILGASTALLSAAAGWSLIEPTLLQLVRTAL